MRVLAQHILLVALLLILVSQTFAAAPETVQTTRWKKIALPQSQWPGVSQIAIERGGVLWALANNRVYYWDGSGLRSPQGEELRSGSYVTRLWGGRDRDLYISQSSGEEHRGKLYRLSDGESHYVTDFYYEVGHEYPGLHVSPAGLIINWGARFLSAYRDGKWQQHDAKLAVSDVQVADVGSNVVVTHLSKIYVINKAGKVQERDLDISESANLKYSLQICGWGGNRIVARPRGGSGMQAFNIKTGKRVDLKDVYQQLDGWRVLDFFSLGDSDICLRARNEKGTDYAFFKLSAGGKVSRIETPKDQDLSHVRFRQFPASVLRAKDHAIWLATEDGSLTRFHSGKSRRFDWRDGLNIGKSSFVLEAREGIIYAASGKEIAVWHPAGLPLPLPDWVKQWQEYRLASYNPIRDSKGHVWMLLADRPEEISRWDGKRWHHQEFPDEKIYRGIADDQGHLLLAGSNVCFDVSRRSVTRHDNLKSALVAARARGVKRVDTDSSFQGCHFLANGEIWFGYHNYNQVHRYDGMKWSEFSLRDDIYYIYEDPQYGVLIRSQGGKYYRHERGQLIHVTDYAQTDRLLWSKQRFQPFRSALLKKRNRDYVIVENRHVIEPAREVGVNGRKKRVFQVGDALPRYTSSLTRSLKEGHWTDYQAAPIYRIWGSRVIECDWRDTPLNTRYYEIRQVLDDRAGNLWTYVAGYSQKQVFMKRMDDFNSRATVDDGGTIAVTMDQQWHGQYEPRLFWRVGKGPWQGGEPSKNIAVESGPDAKVEIVAMDRQGGTTEAIHVQLGRQNGDGNR